MLRHSLHTVIFVMLSIGLLGLIFFAPGFAPPARDLLADRQTVSGAVQELTKENESLKAELATLRSLRDESRAESRHGVVSSVYSSYPLGGRNELVINAGIFQGIAPGKAVFSQGTLIGKIGSVSMDSATVVTIFDSNFSLAVRMASSGVNGLLAGGNYPVVTSMPKDANVGVGDVVMSVAQRFPYGAPLGVLGNPTLSRDTLFLEAPLETAYDLQSIKAVTVLAQ